MLLELTDEQEFIINEAVNWYLNSSSNLFQFTGPAGTGKSVVLNSIVARLGLTIDEIAPMSYIGASAIVMRRKGLYNARTIHSWLYNPIEKAKTDINGNVVVNDYFNLPVYEIGFTPKPLAGIKLILIDEGGAVPYQLKEEIDRRGIKTIACGDLNQLPPPMSKPGYLVSGKIYRLTKIMRQAEQSPIIFLSQRASAGLPIHAGVYGNSMVIESCDLTKEMLRGTTISLCGKNKTRDSLNHIIRQLKMNTDIKLPVFNDLLICRKNNWNIESNGLNLANGLIGTVLNNPDPTRFNGKTFSIDFLPLGSTVPFEDVKCDYQYFISPIEQKQFLKNAKYQTGEKFEFAYAITTHISQGSQFNNGIYFEEYLNRDINNKLNYTGITRFSDWLIYVIPSKKYY